MPTEDWPRQLHRATLSNERAYCMCFSSQSQFSRRSSTLYSARYGI